MCWKTWKCYITPKRSPRGNICCVQKRFHTNEDVTGSFSGILLLPLAYIKLRRK